MEIIIFILWMSAAECKQQRWWRWLNAGKTSLKAPLVNCDFVLAPGVWGEAAWSGMLCWSQVSVKMWLLSVCYLSLAGQLPLISSIFLGLNIGQLVWQKVQTPITLKFFCRQSAALAASFFDRMWEQQRKKKDLNVFWKKLLALLWPFYTVMNDDKN